MGKSPFNIQNQRPKQGDCRKHFSLNCQPKHEVFALLAVKILSSNNGLLKYEQIDFLLQEKGRGKCGKADHRGKVNHPP